MRQISSETEIDPARRPSALPCGFTAGDSAAPTASGQTDDGGIGIEPPAPQPETHAYRSLMARSQLQEQR